MADQWKVVTNNDLSRVRTLFAGLEKDARDFIARNFPRPHVEPPSQEPGVHDVKLVGPNGEEDLYHADEGWQSENQDVMAPEPAPSAPASGNGSVLA